MHTNTSILRNILTNEGSKNYQEPMAKPYGFYWSKKSHLVAAAVYTALTKPGDVVCDPFLGSGSSLYGLSAIKGKRTFIGVEINEMPVRNISFNLQCLNASMIKEMQTRFNVFSQQVSKVYEYPCQQCKNQMVIKNATVDIGAQYIPRSFDFICPSCGEYEINEGSNVFKRYSEQYIVRQELYGKKNQGLENQILTKNSRIAVRSGMRISDLFSPVNFYLLDLYKDFFKNDNAMLVLLSGVLHLCKFTDQKSQSQFPYWYPKTQALDRNILIAIQKKVMTLKPQSQFLHEAKDFERAVNHIESAYCLINKSILDVSDDEIPEESIDLILTDPPYFDQVAYSEYLKLWEYFTGFKAHFKGEIIESQRETLKTTRDDYLAMMSSAFERMGRMIKKRGTLLTYFKDSKMRNMNDYLELVEKAGFSFEEQGHIDKGKFTYKQNNDPQSTVQGDCLLLFKKRNRRMNNFIKEIDPPSCENLIRDFVGNYLQENDKASLGELIDNGLLVMLHNKGVLSLVENDVIINVLNNHFMWDNSLRAYTDKSRINHHIHDIEECSVESK